MNEPTTITLTIAAAVQLGASLIAYGRLAQKADHAASASAAANEAVIQLGKEVAEVRGILLGSNGHAHQRQRK